MSDFYDWTKTLSYDAPVTMVCTARGKGKTFGLREQCVRDFLKDGSRFCAVVRHKAKLQKVTSGFFEKLQKEGKFLDYAFKIEGAKAYITPRELYENKTPNWELIGYFVALTEAQDTKEMTFANVRRLFLDEFILDPNDRTHFYLYDEYTKFVTIIDSVFRENPNNENAREPRIYLIGNALNVINPYFHIFGIYDLPPEGYSWHKGKTVLLHYDDDETYSQAKASGTLAGRLYEMSAQSKQNVHNKFVIRNMENVKKKSARAIFVYGLVWRGSKFGVWADGKENVFYVNRKIPPNREDDTLALTLEDKEFNHRIARRNERRILALYDFFREGKVFFDTEGTRQALFEIFALHGARMR